LEKDEEEALEVLKEQLSGLEKDSRILKRKSETVASIKESKIAKVSLQVY